MSALDQDIKDAIAKSLPAVTAGVLTDRLKQADKDAARVVELERELAQRRTELTTFTANITAVREELERAKAALAVYAKREADFEASERSVLVASMNEQAARMVTAAVQDTMRIVFGNTEVKRVTMHSVSTPLKIMQGGYESVQHHSTTDTTQETVIGS